MNNTDRMYWFMWGTLLMGVLMTGAQVVERNDICTTMHGEGYIFADGNYSTDEYKCIEERQYLIESIRHFDNVFQNRTFIFDFGLENIRKLIEEKKEMCIKSNTSDLNNCIYFTGYNEVLYGRNK